MPAGGEGEPPLPLVEPFDRPLVETPVWPDLAPANRPPAPRNFSFQPDAVTRVISSSSSSPISSSASSMSSASSGPRCPRRPRCPRVLDVLGVLDARVLVVVGGGGHCRQATAAKLLPVAAWSKPALYEWPFGAVVALSDGQYGRLMDFRDESVAGWARMVREGGVSAGELTDHALGQIGAWTGAQCLRLCQRRQGAPVGRRHRQKSGCRHRPWTLGRHSPGGEVSLGRGRLCDHPRFPVFAGDAPASSDSALVARLVAAGCVVVGKTNTQSSDGRRTPTIRSLAHTQSMESGPFTRRFVGRECSSHRVGHGALGHRSDGGGSIRIPSACCGLSGMKPSHGRVPTEYQRA